MTLRRVKAVQSGDTLTFEAYGKRLYTRFANSYQTYENVTLTPSLKKELEERIKCSPL